MEIKRQGHRSQELAGVNAVVTNFLDVTERVEADIPSADFYKASLLTAAIFFNSFLHT